MSTRFAKVENGEITNTHSRPKWLDKNGEQITDDSKFLEGGYYPIVDDPPDYDPKTQKRHGNKVSEWNIFDDHVEKTYEVTDKSLETIKEEKTEKIEAERVKRTELMPYTTPDSVDVKVKLQEEAPNKPRQTWLSGTCSWALAEVQEGNSDATDDLIAADDTTHTMTASDWVTFGKKLKAWVKDNLSAAKQHMQAVEDLDAVEDIIDYDYTKDYWPS